MAIALITINGIAGSNTNLPLSALVQLNNQGDGSETSWLWILLAQPEGSTAALSSATVANPTFTPDKEGSYLVQLTVNAGTPGQSVNTAIVGVLQIKSHIRIPAPGETTETDAGDGWGITVNEWLNQVDESLVSPMTFVAIATQAIVTGNVVFINGDAIAANGEKLPTVAVAHATLLTESQNHVFVMTKRPSGATSAGVDDLVQMIDIGLYSPVNYSGSPPSVLDPIYVSDAGFISTTPGTNSRTVGRVIAVNTGASTYDVFFDTTSFVGEAPANAAYLLTAPNAGLTNATNVTALTNTLTFAVAPTFDVLPIAIKQSAALPVSDAFQIQTSTGTPFFRVDATGDLILVNAGQQLTVFKVDSTAALTIGASTATSIVLGNGAIPIGVNGSLTVTGSLTQTTGTVSLTGNTASILTTSASTMSVDAFTILNVGVSTATGVTIGKPGGTSTVSLNTNRIQNLADPVGPQDAVTKNYVATTLPPITAPYLLNGPSAALTAATDVTNLSASLTFKPTGTTDIVPVVIKQTNAAPAQDAFEVKSSTSTTLVSFSSNGSLVFGSATPHIVYPNFQLVDDGAAYFNVFGTASSVNLLRVGRNATNITSVAAKTFIVNYDSASGTTEDAVVQLLGADGTTQRTGTVTFSGSSATPTYTFATATGGGTVLQTGLHLGTSGLTSPASVPAFLQLNSAIAGPSATSVNMQLAGTAFTQTAVGTGVTFTNSGFTSWTMGASTNVSMGSNQVHNVVNPTSAQDAATKNYTDTSFPPIASVFLLNSATIGTLSGATPIQALTSPLVLIATADNNPIVAIRQTGAATGDILRLQSSTPTTLASFSSNGSLVFASATPQVNFINIHLSDDGSGGANYLNVKDNGASKTVFKIGTAATNVVSTANKSVVVNDDAVAGTAEIPSFELRGADGTNLTHYLISGLTPSTPANSFSLQLLASADGTNPTSRSYVEVGAFGNTTLYEGRLRINAGTGTTAVYNTLATSSTDSSLSFVNANGTTTRTIASLSSAGQFNLNGVLAQINAAGVAGTAATSALSLLSANGTTLYTGTLTFDPTSTTPTFRLSTSGAGTVQTGLHLGAVGLTTNVASFLQFNSATGGGAVTTVVHNLLGQAYTLTAAGTGVTYATSGFSAFTIDATTVNLGLVTATSIAMGHSGITTTITGGLTQLTGVFSFTGNSASGMTTSSGATTIDSAAAVNIGLSTATALAFGRSGITTTITGGLTQLTGAFSFTGNAASGLTTSAGATTIDSAAALNLGASTSTSVVVGHSGASCTVFNNGAFLFATLPLGNFLTGGSIGTAAATVDSYASISIAQTTAGQTLTLQNPTNTTSGRVLQIINDGSVAFGLLSATFQPGALARLVWDSVGSAWRGAPTSQTSGAAGSVLLSNGNNGFETDATNFFWDTTNHRLGILTNAPTAALSFGSASTINTLAGALTIDSAAGLNLGISVATAIAIGRTGVVIAVAGALAPATDNVVAVGSSLFRFASVTSLLHDVYTANTDTQPSARLSASSVLLGVGGSTAPDLRIQRSVASTMTVDNGAGTPGPIATLANAATVRVVGYDLTSHIMGPCNSITGCMRVSSTAAQTFTTNTQAQVTFNTTDINQGGTPAGGALFSFGGNLITINAAGVYRVDVAGPEFSAAALGATNNLYALVLQLNGTTSIEEFAIASPTTVGSTAATWKGTLTVTRTFASGNTIGVLFTQVTGANKTTDVSVEGRYPKMTITQLI